MPRVFSHVLNDNTVAIIRLGTVRSTDPVVIERQEQRWLAKTLFELHRSELVNPLLSGQELELWQRTVHFNHFQDPPVREAREITGEILPDYARRHAWREGLRAGRLEIFDDRTIPDLPPKAGG